VSKSLSAKQLRDELAYDPESGLFTRLKARVAAHVGMVAGTINKHTGYTFISVRGTQYYAHRLAWLHVHCRWPDQIDHINGNRSDNRLANLRECSVAENAQNMKPRGRSDNKSGHIGVHWDSHTSKWRAAIKVGGRTIRLGRFGSVQEASEAYARAKASHHSFQPTLRSAHAE
jgi:hypothetical protein